MVRRRKELGLTQAELGARIATSQNMISNIESGAVGSSKFVLPICKILSIPPPMFFEDEEQKAWFQVGYLLRNKSMKKFRRILEMAEAVAEEDDDAAASNDQRPPNRK